MSAIAIGTFRKNVLKTLNAKSAKNGLRLASKNTVRTHVAHGAVSLATNSGQLVQSLTPYLLGAQFSPEMKADASTAMGDVGHDLTVLCRLLKVKLPSSTKKLKLTGTRSAAILHLNGLAVDILRVVQTGIFVGPVMTKVTKDVVLPNKGGIKESREVDVIDTEAEKTADTARQDQIKSLLTAMVDVYWRLSFDIFGLPPATLFGDKLARLQAAHPEITFDLTEGKATAVPA
jgi:hypothetical protein